MEWRWELVDKPYSYSAHEVWGVNLVFSFNLGNDNGLFFNIVAASLICMFSAVIPFSFKQYFEANFTSLSPASGLTLTFFFYFHMFLFIGPLCFMFYISVQLLVFLFMALVLFYHLFCVLWMVSISSISCSEDYVLEFHNSNSQLCIYFIQLIWVLILWQALS